MQRILRDIQLNWKSGLTVALVSVPLSLSLSIASGATPIMGIITAIWAGLIAAIFAGSQFNVVGPAGALSGILLAFSTANGVALLPLLAIASGILIFIFFLLRWDRYLVFIPSSVIHGFTLGVGITIALGQINFALGLKGLPAHDTLVLNALESLKHISSADPTTCALFILTLALLFGLARFVPRVPPVIAAAAVGILLGYLSQKQYIPVAIATLFTKYGTFKATAMQIPVMTLPPLTINFAKTVFTVTIVAVLETLLSAKIADGMTGKRFDQKKEMLALALGNIASGFAGGLPATGVLARTSLNVKSGATSRYSSGINALFVLLIALVFFQVFQFLPLAVVAAILVFAAIRMIEVKHFVQLFTFDQITFWLCMIVAGLTVVVDPMVGILVGVTISLLVFAQHLSRGQSELTIHRNRKLIARIASHAIGDHNHDDNDVVVYRLAGELTYFNGRSHEDAIAMIKTKTLIISLRNLFYIDLDGLDTLKEIIKHAKSAGKKVVITGASEYIRPQLEKTTWFAKMEKEKLVFESTTKALSAEGFALGE